VPMNLLDRVLPDFEAWCADHRVPSDSLEQQSHRIYQLLDARGRWGGRRDPLVWRSGDVHGLLDLAVRKVTDVSGLAEYGVETLRAYLEFLEAEDRFRPSSARLPALLRELERAATRFPQAMADTRRYAMAKRFMSAAQHDGIDVADDEALEAWLEQFNARALDERVAFLGPLVEENPELATAQFVNDGSVIAAVNPVRRDIYRAMREERSRPCSCGHPAVRLEPREVLADAAASTVTMRRLAFIGEWCEPGRQVDRHGGPVGAELAEVCAQFGVGAPQGVRIRTLRDVPRCGEVWRLAVQADVVREGRVRAIPGPRAEVAEAVAAGEAQDEAALELWLEAFQAAVIDEDLDDEVSELADRAVKAVLSALYDTRGPITLADVERALEGVVPDWVEEGDVPVLLRAEITQAIELFRRLHHCGAISTAATGEPRGTDGLASAQQPQEIVVTLTPLGVYGVREYLLGTGCDAPVTTE
jgi:hypothetical protein